MFNLFFFEGMKKQHKQKGWVSESDEGHELT